MEEDEGGAQDPAADGAEDGHEPHAANGDFLSAPPPPPPDNDADSEDEGAIASSVQVRLPETQQV